MGLRDEDDPLRELERDAGMGGTGGRSLLLLLLLWLLAKILGLAVAAALPFRAEEAADDEGMSGANDKDRFALSTGAAPEYVFARLASGGEPDEDPEEAAERLEVALPFPTGWEGRFRIVFLCVTGGVTGSAFFFFPNQRKPIARSSISREKSVERG